MAFVGLEIWIIPVTGSSQWRAIRLISLNCDDLAHFVTDVAGLNFVIQLQGEAATLALESGSDGWEWKEHQFQSLGVKEAATHASSSA